MQAPVSSDTDDLGRCKRPVGGRAVDVEVERHKTALFQRS